MVMREKRRCAGCKSKTEVTIDCKGCGVSVCRWCSVRHVCGKDDRGEFDLLLGECLERSDSACRLVVSEVIGFVVAYEPSKVILNRDGLRKLAGSRDSAYIIRGMRSAPVSARGVIVLEPSVDGTKLHCIGSLDNHHSRADVLELLSRS